MFCLPGEVRVTSVGRTVSLLSRSASLRVRSAADLIPVLVVRRQMALFATLLSLFITLVFLRTNFLLKLALMVFTSGAHVLLAARADAGWLTPLLLLTAACALLHALDRQAERTGRADFLWRSKQRGEQDDVETMRGINKVLLENILPHHVAAHFLSSSGAEVSAAPMCNEMVGTMWLGRTFYILRSRLMGLLS